MASSRLMSRTQRTAAVVIVTALAACGGDDGSTEPAPEAAGETTETTSPPSPPPTVERDVDAADDGDVTDAAGVDHAAGDAAPLVGGPGTATMLVDGEVRVMDVACTRFSSSFLAEAEERGGAEWRFFGDFEIDDPADSGITVLPPRAGGSREAGGGFGELHVVVGDGVASGTATATFPEGDGALDVAFELECPPRDTELPVSLQPAEGVEAGATVMLGDEPVEFASAIPVCLIRADGRGFSFLSLPSPAADLSLGFGVDRRGGEDSVRLTVRENDTGNVLLPGEVLWQADSTRRGTIAALEVSDDGRTASGAGQFESPEGATIPMTFEVTCD